MGTCISGGAGVGGNYRVSRRSGVYTVRVSPMDDRGLLGLARRVDEAFPWRNDKLVDKAHRLRAYVLLLEPAEPGFFFVSGDLRLHTRNRRCYPRCSVRALAS